MPIDTSEPFVPHRLEHLRDTELDLQIHIQDLSDELISRERALIDAYRQLRETRAQIRALRVLDEQEPAGERCSTHPGTR